MYYKDSIRLEFNLTDILGNGLNLDDFYIRVVLSAGGAGKFVAERFSSDTERNCELSGDILTVTANRHGLRPGKLTAEVTALMSGGHRMTRIIDTGITLTETDTILPDTAPFRVAYPLLKGPQGIQGEPFLFADLTAAQKKELAQPAVDEAAKFGDTVDQLDADFKVVAGMHLAFQKEIEKAENIKGEMRLRFRTADGFWLGFGFHPGQSSVGMGYRTNEADAAIWTIEPFEGNTYFLMKNRHDQYVKFGAYRIELTDDRKQATPVGILQHPKDPQYFRICQMDNNNLCIGGDSVKDWSPAYCDKSPDNATTRLIVENVDARKLGLLDGKDMWMGAPISVTNHEDFDKFCTEITRRVDDAERTVTASAQTADSARTDIDIALKEVDSWQEVLDILTATDRAVAAAETARVTEFAELKTEAETATTAATTAAVEAVLAKRALFDDMWLAAVKNYGALDHSHIEEDGCIRPYYLNGLWLTYEEALYSFVAYHKGTNWSEMFAQNRLRIRTNIPYGTSWISVDISRLAQANTVIEVINLPIVLHANANTTMQAFYGCTNLRRVYGLNYLSNSANDLNMFSNCKVLEHLEIKKIAADLNLRWSPLLDKETFEFLIQYATNTKEITITVHPDVYAKLTDEDNEEWYQVMEAGLAKNITFATI